MGPWSLAIGPPTVGALRASYRHASQVGRNRPLRRGVQTWNNWCIEIDRSKRLKDDPGKGHNRWHPDITPILEVDPGEDVVLETRDASDGQMNANVTVDDFPGFAGKVGHPLTGPVYI